MKLINTESTRSYYAPFKTIEQLNANTAAIREQHSEFMTPSEKAVLDVIHRFASKHYGVCYLAKETIGKMVDLSRRQIIRICNKFEALGFFVQYETDRRAGGGQTSNTIVFLTQLAAKDAFVTVDEQMADNMQKEGDVTPAGTPDVTGLDAPKEAPQDSKELREYTYANAGEQAHKPSMYAKIKEFVRSRNLPNAIVSEFSKIMHGMVNKALNENKRLTHEQAESIALEGLHATFTGAIKTNYFAKLSGIIKRKFAELTGIENGELMSEYEVAARRGKFKRMPQWLADKKGLTAEEQDRLEAINMVALKASGVKIEELPEWYSEHKAEQANKTDVESVYNSVSAEQAEAARAQLFAALGY